MKEILAIGCGGFLGSLIMGVLMALKAHNQLNMLTPLFLSIGFLGAYTTFFTFSFDNLRLIQERQWALMAGNILLNVFLSLGGVTLGYYGTNRFAGS